jgi:peptidyl-dipeptidase A
MTRFLAGVAAGALLAAASLAHAAAAPTAADAKAFVDKAEADLNTATIYAGHAGWVQATYINEDTNFLAAKAQSEGTELGVRLAKEAKAYDGLALDPVTRRKLDLIKRGVDFPSPARAGAADELANIGARLSEDYATGKFAYHGKTLNLDEAEDILRTSRDPAELKAVWEGWRTISPKMAKDYARQTVLADEGARELGYKDVGALWRNNYDMDPDAFAAEVDRVWTQVQPFYRNLHCYVRTKLNEKYGDAVQPKSGPIRADLLGNMWAQEWGNIYDVVAPKDGGSLGYDLTDALEKKGYDAQKLVKTGEAFYVSLGMGPLPDTFWTRSQFVRPRDREVVCHASAWPVDNARDVRVKVCFKATADDFFTAHHELGHDYYFLAYADQPPLFRGGANDGFHEAIGDFAGLSALTPTYLKTIGVIDKVPGPEADIPYLLRQAMDRIAFLPFGLLVDKWRWQVFSGQVTPEHYNDAWWALVKQYQGLTPPGPRPADAFDPGAKYHIPGNTPYMRYFLARIYQFQFYRAACRQAGWTGPLNRCSVYGDKKVGEKFNAMLKLGQSKPWPEALEAFTGEKRLDASAIADYFAPLNVWLTKQNKGQTCGW